jgi:hypothetical protein
MAHVKSRGLLLDLYKARTMSGRARSMRNPARIFLDCWALVFLFNLFRERRSEAYPKRGLTGCLFWRRSATGQGPAVEGNVHCMFKRTV